MKSRQKEIKKILSRYIDFLEKKGILIQKDSDDSSFAIFVEEEEEKYYSFIVEIQDIPDEDLQISITGNYHSLITESEEFVCEVVNYLNLELCSRFLYEYVDCEGEQGFQIYTQVTWELPLEEDELYYTLSLFNDSLVEASEIIKNFKDR